MTRSRSTISPVWASGKTTMAFGGPPNHAAVSASPTYSPGRCEPLSSTTHTCSPFLKGPRRSRSSAQHTALAHARDTCGRGHRHEAVTARLGARGLRAHLCRRLRCGPGPRACAPRTLPSPPGRGQDRRAGDRRHGTGAAGSAVPEKPLSGRVITIDPGHNGGNFTHPLQIGRLVNDGNGEKECGHHGHRRARRIISGARSSTGASRCACARFCSRRGRGW